MRALEDRADPRLIRTIMVETGAVCNLRCPFCPTGNGSAPLERKFLSAARFERLLDSFPDIKAVHLFRFGEPLLNPDFPRIVLAAARRGLVSGASSNMSLAGFDKAAARALVRNGLAWLLVSLDGADQESYAQYRIGGSFKIALRNLKLVLEAKREDSALLPVVKWQYLIHKGNEARLGAARAAARKLGVALAAQRLRFGAENVSRWAPAKPWRDRTYFPPAGRERSAWLLLDAMFRGSKSPYDLPVDVACSQAWNMPGLDGVGNVYPCCAVSDPRYSLGNIFERPLERIWNSSLAVAMRRYLRTGKSVRPLPCHGCFMNPRIRIKGANAPPP